MGKPREHLAKAARNEAFLAAIATTEYLEWAVTVTFYAALHYLRALLATKGHTQDFMEYSDFERTLASAYPRAQCRPVWEAYRQLKDDSWNARYSTTRAFTPEEARELRNDELRRIRTFAERVFGRPLPS